MYDISVIVPTHNPHAGRYARTLDALKQQTFDHDRWELIIVDNASQPGTRPDPTAHAWHPQGRIVREAELGLTRARVRGFREAGAQVLLLVDDDNVLAPDYLALVHASFTAEQRLGALGGRSLPEFETQPPAWVRQFDGLLALRDPGATPMRAAWTTVARREYPSCAPIGAGFALRRAAARRYCDELATNPHRSRFDRTGQQLISGGDNDLVMTVLESDFEVGYNPALKLTHLIPASRCTRPYLGALNRAIARSWVRVLALHRIRPWRAIRPETVRLRQWRAWIRTRAWAGPVQWITWQGACGHFEGLAQLEEATSTS